MSTALYLTRLVDKWDKPRGHNGLDAGFQLNDPDLRLFVQMGSLDVEEMRPSSEAVCFAGIIKGIEDLDFTALVLYWSKWTNWDKAHAS